MNLEQMLLEIEQKKALEIALLALYAKSKAFVKIIMATQGKDKWWDDHLRQLVEPQTYRPVHHKPEQVYSNIRYNPLTGLEEEYYRVNQSGAPKKTAYTKKTDLTLSHPEGKTSFYPGPLNTTDIYAVGLVYDADQMDPNKLPKYTFLQYSNTNFREWKKPLPTASNDKRKAYWGALTPPPRSVDEEVFREYSRNNEWKVTPAMRCVSKASVSGVCVSQNTLCNRINAIHKQQLTQKSLGKNLPIVLMPEQSKPDSRLNIYTAFAQLTDILHMLERTDNGPGSVPGKLFVAQIDIAPIMSEAFLREGALITQSMVDDLVKLFIDSKNDVGLAFLIDFLNLPTSENRVEFNRDLKVFSRNPIVLNTSNQTVWHYAVIYKMKSLLTALVENNIEFFNARCTSNKTALMQAIRLGDMSVVDILLRHVDKLDSQHANNVFTQLVSLGEIERANLLLEKLPSLLMSQFEKYGVEKTSVFYETFFEMETCARNSICFVESVDVTPLAESIERDFLSQQETTSLVEQVEIVTRDQVLFDEEKEFFCLAEAFAREDIFLKSEKCSDPDFESSLILKMKNFFLTLQDKSLEPLKNIFLMGDSAFGDLPRTCKEVLGNELIAPEWIALCHSLGIEKSLGKNNIDSLVTVAIQLEACMGYEKEKLLPIQTRIIVALKTLIKNGAFSKNLFALLNQDRPKLVEIRAECEAIMRADNNYKKISIGRRLFSDCPSPLLVALCEKISALEVENVKACAVLAQWLESTLPSKTTALAR